MSNDERVEIALRVYLRDWQSDGDVEIVAMMEDLIASRKNDRDYLRNDQEILCDIVSYHIISNYDIS